VQHIKAAKKKSRQYCNKLPRSKLRGIKRKKHCLGAKQASGNRTLQGIDYYHAAPDADATASLEIFPLRSYTPFSIVERNSQKVNVHAYRKNLGQRTSSHSGGNPCKARD
jgi:hypothetical protein